MEHGHDGKPAGPTGDLGDFKASGEPKTLTDRGAASLDGVTTEAKAALREASGGAALGPAKKLGGTSVEGEKAPVPTDTGKNPSNYGT